MRADPCFGEFWPFLADFLRNLKMFETEARKLRNEASGVASY